MRPRISPLQCRPPWASILVVLAAATSGRLIAAAEVEAYSGRPFGVGMVTLPSTFNDGAGAADDDRLIVQGQDGRVLYPVAAVKPVRQILRNLLEIEGTPPTSLYFLFVGDGPLSIRVPGADANWQATPQTNVRRRERLLEAWWQAYAARWQRLRREMAYPPLVENFLTANLSRRMRLPMPKEREGLLSLWQEGTTPWDVLFVTERHQLTVDRQLLTPEADESGPAEPLPPPLPWLSPQPQAGEAVAVEPLALHVPVECFYLRFGAFTNYLWFRDLNQKWSGDLGNMVSRRGIDREVSRRLEQQLSLRENALAKVLGPAVIADVAILGLDPPQTPGAAIGILFQAKNSQLLGADLNNQRREALRKFSAAKESTVTIAGQDVSLISTPRGEVRSYYAVDGDFHLVTTSRRLAERFLACGAEADKSAEGDASLGLSSGFQGVRRRLPVDRDDAIFAYVSPEFVRELTSPARWIESRRRTRSLRAAKLVEVARAQAAAEGSSATTLANLTDEGYLPQNFAASVDGSSLEFGDLGSFRFTDSRRGAPGFYVSAADLPAETASPAESAAYRRFADRFRQEAGQTPPLAVAIIRRPREGGGETLGAEIVATPLEEVQLGRLRDVLGTPQSQRLAPLPSDLIHLEVAIERLLPVLGSGDQEPHHLFAALRDSSLPVVVQEGLATPQADRGSLAGYWGTWPKPGWLHAAFGEVDAAPGPLVQQGADGWLGRNSPFFLMSFQEAIVRDTLPKLTLTDAATPAQLWLDVANLAGTKLARAANALGYQRAREASVSACRLMNALHVQLHVPADRCRPLAEQLVDGQFACPLGGQYQQVSDEGGSSWWTSTAVTAENRFFLASAPADFQLTVWQWLRGLRADFALEENAMTARLEIDMEASALP